MRNILKIIGILWKYRSEFGMLRVEILELSKSVKTALQDKKLSKQEAVDILRNTDDILEIVIEMLED